MENASTPPVSRNATGRRVARMGVEMCAAFVRMAWSARRMADVFRRNASRTAKEKTAEMTDVEAFAGCVNRDSPAWTTAASSPLPAFRIAKTFNVGMTAAAESVGIARKTGSASRGPANWFVKPSAWRKNAVLTGVAESAGPVPSERNAAHSFSAKRWDVRLSAGIRNAVPMDAEAFAGSARGIVFAWMDTARKP